MGFKKAIAAVMFSGLLLMPAAVLPASAASGYSNDFSQASLKDFDTTTANALVKDGSLQLKKGDGDAAVILKTEKYENFTLEVDITVTDFNDGGAPFILYHTQEPNNPFTGGTYTSVFYQTDVKGCFFAPYSDNGWIRSVKIYEGSNTFHIKLEVNNNYATFYVGDTLLGSFDSGTEHTSGYVGLGSYKAAVNYDNLKVTPNAPASGNQLSKGKELVSDDFSGSMGKNWVSKNPSEISVADGKFKVAAAGQTDRYALYSNSLKDEKYVVETTFNIAGGNAGLLVKGGYNADNAYEGYSFTYDKEFNLMKASRYHNGYVSCVEDIRVAPLSGEHTMTVYVDGARHSMYVDGKLILEFVDSTFKDGSAGFISYNGTASFDDLKVYAAGDGKVEPTTPETEPPVETQSTEDNSSSKTTSGTPVTTVKAPTTTAGGSEDGGLPGFAIPLIVLGVLVVLGGAGAVVYVVLKKKKAAKS